MRPELWPQADGGLSVTQSLAASSTSSTTLPDSVLFGQAEDNYTIVLTVLTVLFRFHGALSGTGGLAV